MVLGVSSSGILDSRVSLRGSDRCRFAVGALLGSAGALTVPLHWQRDDVIRRELFPGPICHEECKGGEIRDEQGRRISALCATVRGNCAHLSGRGKAGSWLRLAHLAQANRQIAELAVQIARQRVIVKHALDTGQGSEMAESLLDALEGSLRIFEKHRIFLLWLERISSALPPGEAARGRSLSRHNGRGAS